MNQVPIWHNFNIRFHTPNIHSGMTVQVSPLLVGSINGDFDDWGFCAKKPMFDS